MNRFKDYTYPRDGTTGIIILGDAGINYYLNNRDTSVKKKLQNSGYQFYLVRGNHEARPEDCKEIEWFYDGNVNNIVGTDFNYPAIHYFRDGNIYVINGYNCLVIGGAYSVDKYYRLSRGYPYQWFENEQLNESERNEILESIKGKEFDFVLTHTCPRAWEPIDLFLPGMDQSQIDKSMEDWLDKVKDAIKYKIWLFGHFHADRIEKHSVQQFFVTDENLDIIWQRWTLLKKPEEWIERNPFSEI